MDKEFAYRKKHVHDICVGESFVRLWDSQGPGNSRVIEKSFQPLVQTGFVYPYVALMPDYHPGEEAMIGSVIPTREVILPSVIGGDLGCGMTAVRLPLQFETISGRLGDIQGILKERIPVGSAHNAFVTERVKANPIWRRDTCAPILTNRLQRKLMRQFGSLGGGNHFLELQRDEEDGIWVMVHSGSRYLGVMMRDYYVEAGRNQERIDSRLYFRIPYLTAHTKIAEDYLSDLQFVIDFARESRKEMMMRVLEAFAASCGEDEEMLRRVLADNAYDAEHNYTAEEEFFGTRLFVHRKGAIRVRKGQTGLVPGSMGTCSYVVEGRGNEFSFCSCSHGAGRAMSRGAASRAISDSDFRRSMKGVIYEHDRRIKDEAPGAYKSIQQVMRGQKDLVKILYKLRPVVSIKGY